MRLEEEKKCQIPIEQLPFSYLNTEPVGAGPFALKEPRRDENGLIQSYELSANKETTDPPQFDTFMLHFYSDEQLNAIYEKINR